MAGPHPCLGASGCWAWNLVGGRSEFVGDDRWDRGSGEDDGSEVGGAGKNITVDTRWRWFLCLSHRSVISFVL